MRRTRLTPEDRPLSLQPQLPTPEELQQYGLKKLCAFVAAHTSDEIGDLFHENAVDGSSFLHLDAEELSRMGIREAGTRVKISRLIHDVSSADEAVLHANAPATSWEISAPRGAPRSVIPPALQPLSSRHPLPYTPRTAALGEAFASPLSPSLVCDTPTGRLRSCNGKMLGADGFDGVSLSGTTEPYQKKRFSEHVKRVKHESSKTPLHHHMWGTLHRAEAIPGSEEYWEARYQKLDEISADAARWIEFVEEREDNRGGEETFAWGDFKVSAKLEEKTSQLDLNEMYDLTAERLEQLFIRFDNDDDGFMAIYELGRALKHQGLGRLDPKLKQIFQAVAAPNEWRLTVPEFSVALTCLKLAELFVHAHQSELGSMSVLDFDSDTAHFTKHVKDYSNFFFGHRAEGAVRWIHVTKPTKTLLLLLSVKYRLHPLGVEDAMEATDHVRVPTKFDRYGAHFFLQVNYFFLENTDFEKDDRITFNTSEIGMFVAGAPQWDTVITIIHGPSPKDRGRHRRNLDASDVDNNNLDVWESIQKKLQSTHARSRENKSDFLMYDLLTVCLNELKPIVQAYRRRLSEFHELLLQVKCGFPEEKLTELSWIALELGDLHRNLRPVKHVIRQVNEENSITPQCKLYLSNLHEDIEQAVYDITLLRDTCKSLANDYDRFQEFRLNDTLGILTVASSVFMPAQYLTGVWGMNFEHMPELKWEYSYVFFWIVMVTYFVVAGHYAWVRFGRVLRIKQRPSHRSPGLRGSIAEAAGEMRRMASSMMGGDESMSQKNGKAPAFSDNIEIRVDADACSPKSHASSVTSFESSRQTSSTASS